jgi:signal transduction histidine kinase
MDGTRRPPIDRIRRSLELTDADTALIRQAAPRLAPEIEGWVERFYARLLRDPVAADLLRDEALQLRIRRSLTAWWHEVFALPIDEAYVRTRRAIGRTHARMGLPHHMLISAMGAMERDVIASITRVHASSPMYGRAIAASLGKVLDLELSLMLDATLEAREELRREGAPPVPTLPRSPEPTPVESVRALAVIGRATATFAHDIRNPLAALGAAIDLLKRDLVPPERAEVAASALQRLEHMRRLLDDTLRLAKPVHGVPVPLVLEDVARSTWSELKDDPAFRDVAVSFIVKRPSPRAIGHADGVRLAVGNLLLNAAEAQSGRGAIRVRISARNGTASLRVEDDGPGISPEARERAFEPFWTTKTTGNGLGLPLVRRVAEAAGGRAYLADAAGGACVCFELPVAPTRGAARGKATWLSGASPGAACGSGPGRG